MIETRRQGLIVGAVGLLLALALSVPAQAAGAKPAEEKRLQRALNDLVDERGGPPGVSALLRRGDRETFITAGVADVETGRPIKTRTYMRIASVSKAFSGAVALSLVDRGVLSLDDTIASRLSDMPTAWGAVTLRQLLQHTGGVPSFSESAAYQQYFAAHLDGPYTHRMLVDFVADQPLRFPPGTSYEYSNTDNVIIALMAEAATGKPYDQLLSELVFDPLGLKRTGLPSGVKFPGPRIHGYDTNPLEDLTECCTMGALWASGGLYSTPQELTRFVRGYVDGSLFGDAVRAQQFQFVAGGHSEPPGPGVNSAGLGMFRYATKCGTVFGHTGNFIGYTQFTAATRNGRRSVTVSASRQLAPTASGKFAPEVFAKLRRDYRKAVCALLG